MSQPHAQNPSYVRDQQRKEEKWEEQVTIYLGKPAKELRPWYSDLELKSGEERKKTDEQRLEQAYKDGENKRLSDPLALINSYLAPKVSYTGHVLSPTAASLSFFFRPTPSFLPSA